LRVQKCTVSFLDRRRIRHSVDVQAASSYEAVCKAWAIFRSVELTAEESYKMEEFRVDIDERESFAVNLDKLLKFVNRGPREKNETAYKQKLRNLLDADVSKTGATSSA
jgi:hypothetical protein